MVRRVLHAIHYMPYIITLYYLTLYYTTTLPIIYYMLYIIYYTPYIMNYIHYTMLHRIYTETLISPSDRRIYDRRVRNKRQITHKKIYIYKIYTKLKYKITNLIARLELAYFRLKSGFIKVSNIYTYYYICYMLS